MRNRALTLRLKKFRKTSRSCYFVSNLITYIDYKDVKTLSQFVNKSGEIMPRNITGIKSNRQRSLARAIKRARFLALMR